MNSGVPESVNQAATGQFGMSSSSKYAMATQKFVMHLLEKENIFQNVEEKKDAEELHDVPSEEEDEEEEVDLDLEEREQAMNELLESEEDEEDYIHEDSDNGKNKIVELSKEDRDHEFREQGFVKRAPGKR